MSPVLHRRNARARKAAYLLRHARVPHTALCARCTVMRWRAVRTTTGSRSCPARMRATARTPTPCK